MACSHKHDGCTTPVEPLRQHEQWEIFFLLIFY